MNESKVSGVAHEIFGLLTACGHLKTKNEHGSENSLSRECWTKPVHREGQNYRHSGFEVHIYMYEIFEYCSSTAFLVNVDSS